MLKIKIGNNSKNLAVILKKEDLNNLPENVQHIFKSSRDKKSVYTLGENFTLYYVISEKYTSFDLKTIASNIYSILKDFQFKDLTVRIQNDSLDKKELLDFIDGMFISSYEFLKYKKEPKPFDINLSFDSIKISQSDLDRLELINNKVYLARDLVNQSNADINTLSFSEIVETEGKKQNLKVTILDESELIKLGMGLITAVGQGGATPPRIAILEYEGNPKSSESIALVGKGMVYDTGGLNIKPTGSMETMRCDMAGAATVFATILIASELKLNVNIKCFLALADNGVDAKSYKPGDTFKAYNGKFVEIGNTDAEGRLVLADTIAYAVDKFKPTSIIDVATLTGACMIALGAHTAGVMGNNEDMSFKIIKAGKTNSENFWELPMFDEFSNSIKGQFSDLKNISSERYGGAMSGAAFIKEFVNETPWIHLDIAGPAFMDKPFGYYSYGASGFAIKSLISYLESL